MRRTTAAALLAALLGGCVTVETPSTEPRGGVAPGQRLIVLVYQSPGPWIVADPDSKAETAMKLLPIGGFWQGVQEDRINELSKEIQPYLPRPRYDQALEAALIKGLKRAHGGPVQSAAEAGITVGQRKDWNAASDQLDWRRKYYFIEQGRGPPRAYSKLLSLDDAVIVEVNLSFGAEPAEGEEQERTLPMLSAAARAYRADTTRMIWGREEKLADTSSSSTLTEFRAAPADLTDRLYAMADPLGGVIASAFAQAIGLTPAPPPVAADVPPAPAETQAPVTAAPPDAPAAPTEPVTAAPPAQDTSPVTPPSPPVTSPGAFPSFPSTP